MMTTTTLMLYGERNLSLCIRQRKAIKRAICVHYYVKSVSYLCLFVILIGQQWSDLIKNINAFLMVVSWELLKW